MTAMSHYYTLQKYTNPSSRHTCPACGRQRCFTLYVDPDANPLHETVGRCDHESSCGYHRTPRQYFHDHPEHRHHCHPERTTVIPSERSESRNLLHYRHALPPSSCPTPIGHLYPTRLPIERLPVKPAMTTAPCNDEKTAGNDGMV